ncbi:MAG: hypothetical protein HC917_09570 [Richelia sp. SM2_1_7]|nr:hypothetical protein [Richelia sp. SM2_1_7]
MPKALSFAYRLLIFGEVRYAEGIKLRLSRLGFGDSDMPPALSSAYRFYWGFGISAFTSLPVPICEKKFALNFVVMCNHIKSVIWQLSTK